MTTTRLHATALQFQGKGFLLIGEPGSGKSDLALILLERGAVLIADDQVLLTHVDNRVIAEAPDDTKGLLHVRGLGLLHVPSFDRTEIDFILKATAEEDIMPEKTMYPVMDTALPCYGLNFHHAATPAKISVLTGIGAGDLVSLN